MEERNSLHTKKKRRRRQSNSTGHIFRRNCLLKHVTDGKIKGRTEGEGRQGRTRKNVLDYLKEIRGHWKLKEEALGALYGDVALYEAMVQS